MELKWEVVLWSLMAMKSRCVSWRLRWSCREGAGDFAAGLA